MRSSLRTAGLCALLGLCSSSRAYAGDTVVGYQLRATQSVASTLSNQALPPPLFGMGTTTAPATTATGQVTQLQGVQLNTLLGGTLSLDFLSASTDTALILGATFNQLLPEAQPDNGMQIQPVSTVTLTSTLLTRLVRPTYGFGASVGYSFAQNGRFGIGADGSQLGTAAGSAAGGGSSVLLQGVTHTLTARAEFQETHTYWDFDVALPYTYTANGVFSLGLDSPGAAAAAAAGQGSTSGSALTQFVTATRTHALAPRLVYRMRLDNSNDLNLTGTSPISLPVSDTNQPGAVLLAPTAAPSLLLEYLHLLGRDSGIGARVQGTMTFRQPTVNQPVLNDDGSQKTDMNGNLLFTPGLKGPLSLDAEIYDVRAEYRDSYRKLGDLQLELSAGIAQAYLYQPANGVGAGGYPRGLAGPVEPVVSLRLARRFNPIDINLLAQRVLRTGTLGASVVVADTASLSFQYLLAFQNRTGINFNLGLNAARVRGINPDPTGMYTTPLTGNNLQQLTAPANSDALSATAGVAVPLISEGGFTMFTSVNYVLSWVDLDPARVIPRMDMSGIVGELPFTTHLLTVSLSLVYGEGTGRKTGVTDQAAIEAFGANPATGSPLISARLQNQGARLLQGTDGIAPGLQPGDHSREAYEEAEKAEKLRREELERKQKGLKPGEKEKKKINLNGTGNGLQPPGTQHPATTVTTPSTNSATSN